MGTVYNAHKYAYLFDILTIHLNCSLISILSTLLIDIMFQQEFNLIDQDTKRF